MLSWLLPKRSRDALSHYISHGVDSIITVVLITFDTAECVVVSICIF